MIALRVCSVTIRLVALAWSVRLVRSERDPRCLLLTVLLALLATRSVLWLLLTAQDAPPADLPGAVWVTVLIELAVSISALAGTFAVERMMRARRQIEARITAIIENTPNVAVEMYNAQGVVLSWNRAAERLFGWAAGEAVGRTLDRLILNAEEHAQFLAVLCDIERTGQPHGPTEWLVRTRSGEPRWAYSTIFALPPTDRPRRFICMDVDVTARKRAEEAARAAQQELVAQHEREAERVAAELAKARDELVRQTRLATVGRISAQIAHEIRNPLSSIKNSCFYLARKLPPAEPKCREHLDGIEREVAACDRIIESLLDATRLKPPHRETLDVCALLTDLISRLERPAEVAVRLVCPHNPFPVQADPVQLRQVLGNLLANARDAASPAGEIRIELERADEADVLRVCDTGPGVPPEDHERIFELLFTTKSQGTGLGLPICRQIIQGHGGTLRLIDTGSRGAVFEIRLPRSTPPTSSGSHHD